MRTRTPCWARSVSAKPMWSMSGWVRTSARTSPKPLPSAVSASSTCGQCAGAPASKIVTPSSVERRYQFTSGWPSRYRPGATSARSRSIATAGDRIRARLLAAGYRGAPVDRPGQRWCRQRLRRPGVEGREGLVGGRRVLGAGGRVPVGQAGVERLNPQVGADGLLDVGVAIVVDVVPAVGDAVAVAVAVQPVDARILDGVRLLLLDDLGPPVEDHGSVGLHPVRQAVAVHVALVVGELARVGRIVVDVEPRLVGRRRLIHGVLRTVAVVEGKLVAAVANPGCVLLGQAHAVTVVIDVAVASIERVRIRALARIGQGTRVEIQRRLVLVAVLDPIA